MSKLALVYTDGDYPILIEENNIHITSDISMARTMCGRIAAQPNVSYDVVGHGVPMKSIHPECLLAYQASWRCRECGTLRTDTSNKVEVLLEDGRVFVCCIKCEPRIRADVAKGAQQLERERMHEISKAHGIFEDVSEGRARTPEEIMDTSPHRPRPPRQAPEPIVQHVGRTATGSTFHVQSHGRIIISEHVSIDDAEGMGLRPCKVCFP